MAALPAGIGLTGVSCPKNGPSRSVCLWRLRHNTVSAAPRLRVGIMLVLRPDITRLRASGARRHHNPNDHSAPVTAGEGRAALACLLSRHHHHPGWLPPSPVHPRSNRGSQSGRGISRGRCGYGELKERVPGPGKSQQFQHSDFQSHRYKLAPWQRTQTNRGDTCVGRPRTRPRQRGGAEHGNC